MISKNSENENDFSLIKNRIKKEKSYQDIMKRKRTNGSISMMEESFDDRSKYEIGSEESN